MQQFGSFVVYFALNLLYIKVNFCLLNLFTNVVLLLLYGLSLHVNIIL